MRVVERAGRDAELLKRVVDEVFDGRVTSRVELRNDMPRDCRDDWPAGRANVGR
jgi:hypothetical protein